MSFCFHRRRRRLPINKSHFLFFSHQLFDLSEKTSWIRGIFITFIIAIFILNNKTSGKYFYLSHIEDHLFKIDIYSQWRNQEEGKWAIVHSIWRFAHWNFDLSGLFTYFWIRLSVYFVFHLNHKQGHLKLLNRRVNFFHLDFDYDPEMFFRNFDFKIFFSYLFRREKFEKVSVEIENVETSLL
jgi:hypothetical protein